MLGYLRTDTSLFHHSDFRTRQDNMENTFATMVNYFTDADERMNFAATLGVQDCPEVRVRLFQLRNQEYGDDFVDENLDNILRDMGGPLDITEPIVEDDLEPALDYVREQEEIEACVKALLYDEEMDETANACVDDGEWNPQSPVMIGGGGEEP